MWKYDSPIGTMAIAFDNSCNKYGLIINEIVYGHYSSAVASADDVFCHVTGCYDWDSLDSQIANVPTDIHKWIKV